MIRQAHTYLAGAVSSTALVAAAVVAFVMLVSLQALKEWPLTEIGGFGGNDSAVTAPDNPGAGAAAAQAPTAGAAAAAPTGARRAAPNRGGHARGAEADQVASVDTSPTATSGSPATDAPSSKPADHQGGGTPPSATSSPTGSASSSPTSGNGGGSSNPGAGAGSGSSAGSKTTSGAVTETVNKTVSGVDEATGGVLGSTGVTGVTEKAVEEVAGPESVVGKTVDEVGKTVGGLLGGGK